MHLCASKKIYSLSVETNRFILQEEKCMTTYQQIKNETLNHSYDIDGAYGA